MLGSEDFMENSRQPLQQEDDFWYLDTVTITRENTPNCEINSGKHGKTEEDDIYKLLAAKDRDLILAAQLGKALLEKNEELSRRNEEIAEEYSNKLEVLQQEKHQLKRQLEVAEEEYQIRLAELQADISSLREALEGHSSVSKLQERARSQAVNDLTEQNQRLTEDLREATSREKELREHLKRMRSQFSKRRNSMQEHFNHMETLRDEIDLVLQKKEDLEKQIQMLLQERENLSSSLELSSRTILELERRHREQEVAIRKGDREVEELRSTNLQLLEKLETMSRSRSSSPSCRMSLQSEIELSGSDSEKSLRRQFDVIDELDEYEFDEEEDDMQCQTVEGWGEDMAEEVYSAYTQLRNMCALIRQREKKGRGRTEPFPDSMDTSSSGSMLGAQRLRQGQLSNLVQEIKSLIHDLIRREAKTTGNGKEKWTAGCSTCGKSVEEKLELEKNLHKTVEELDRGRIGLKQAELTAKRQEDELQILRSKLSLLKTRLDAVEEERTVLKTDLENISASRDQTIRRAWDTRDSAVNRKNSAEVELARARIDVMQANSQLLEAVQQKVLLSQQLEDWQADIETVLEQRLTDSESEKSMEQKCGKPGQQTVQQSLQRTLSKPNSGRRISAFFQR